MKGWNAIAVRISQGTQYIKDVRAAVPKGFRGKPVLGGDSCAEPCNEGCSACRDACPTGAIGLAPLSLDLGRCVFCSACSEECTKGRIAFTSQPRMSAAVRDELILVEGGSPQSPEVRASASFKKLFGRSLRLRQVSSGGCNACELEMNATSNVNFDLQRFGIEWVASPRHADGLVVTGPLTRNMQDAIRLAWDAMPEPRFLVAVGACAISGGLYDGAPGVERSFLDEVAPSLYVAGCPPHPLTFAHAILDLIGRA